MNVPRSKNTPFFARFQVHLQQFWTLFHIKTGTIYQLKTTLFWPFKDTFTKSPPFFYISRTHKKLFFFIFFYYLHLQNLYMNIWSTKPIYTSYIQNIMGKIKNINFEFLGQNRPQSHSTITKTCVILE